MVDISPRRQLAVAAALAALIAVSSPSSAMPVAGKVVHFPKGTWSALAQPGPDGKVRQCVLLAPRVRASKDGDIETGLGITISTGSGLTISIRTTARPRKTFWTTRLKS